MKAFMKNHKAFATFIFIFIFSAGAFKIYDLNNVEEVKKNKEVVYLVLRDDAIAKGITAKVEEFNSINKDIYIDLELYSKDYDNVAVNKMANETKIDIMNYMGKTQIEKEFIKPLDTIGIDYSDLKDGELLKYNDHVVGVKYGSSMPKLMYNDEILIQAGLDPRDKPETLDELMEMCKTIKEKVPGVTPLTFGIGDVHDIFAMFGGPAVSLDTIYPTFWNYKTGVYDYDALKPVMETYREMYKLGLINKDIEKETDGAVLDSFTSGSSAIVLTNYFKKPSVVHQAEHIKVSFSDIPAYDKNNHTKYYFTYQRDLVIANNYDRSTDEDTKVIAKEERDSHDEAVKTVYEWLLEEETTDYLVENDNNFATFGKSGMQGNKFDGLNDNEGYELATYDPTEIFVCNSDIIRSAITSMIKGEIDVEEGVNKLSKDNNNFIDSHPRNENVDREKYKEKSNE